MTTFSARVLSAVLSVLGSVTLVALVDPASPVPSPGLHAAPVVALAGPATARG